MIYLDNGATSFHKPASVYHSVLNAMQTCANPGRGGYSAAEQGAENWQGRCLIAHLKMWYSHPIAPMR